MKPTPIGLLPAYKAINKLSAFTPETKPSLKPVALEEEKADPKDFRVLPFTQNYPENLRRQLWPLCCGASILSGFKDAFNYNDSAEMTAAILDVIENTIPDLQVYAGEEMRPKLTFLTLNESQMKSPMIMKAITDAGFVKFAEASPRGRPQGFFRRDTSETFKTC